MNRADHGGLRAQRERSSWRLSHAVCIGATLLRVVVGVVSGSGVAVAAELPDGSLDPTFGGGGTVTTDFASGSDEANAVLVQGNGKLLVAGRARAQEFRLPDFALARYNPDGSLDQTFGSGGKVATDFGRTWTGIDDVRSVVVQTDDKTVAIGGTDLCCSGAEGGSVHADFALARYTVDGTLDTSYGSGGLVTTDFGFPFGEIATGGVIQPDDKVVAYSGLSFPATFVLARYNPDGNLDQGFGSGGKVATIVVEGNNATGGIATAALQPDGKLVAAGSSTPHYLNQGRNVTLVRYNNDGTVDTTFGVGGLTLTDIDGAGSADQAQAIAVLPDGRILVAGSSATQGSSIQKVVLLRYSSAGVLDPTFGQGGIVTTAIGGQGEAPTALVVQPDGKLVLTVNGDASRIVRFAADGSLDVAFGTSGVVTTGSFSFRDATMQPDGKLVAVGTGPPGSCCNEPDFGVARYLLGQGAASVSPTITSASTATFTVGLDASFAVTATGNPAPALALIGSLPPGVLFDSVTGALSGRPGTGTAGTYRITFSATNGVGPSASQDFTLVVLGSTSVPPLTARFTADPTSGPAPLRVKFADSSTGVDRRYAWDFGDGSPGSTARNPVHVYDRPGLYVVTETVTNAAGRSQATTRITVRAPRYYALGDSYSSGEGVPPFFVDTATHTNQCHRSLGSYAGFFSIEPGADLGQGIGLDSSPTRFLACSGAEIENVVGTAPQRLPNGDPYTGEPEGQYTEVSADADLVTVTMGGNDVGFREVLIACVALVPPCDVLSGGLSDQIDLLYGNLYIGYLQLKARAPNARVVAVTYPQVFSSKLTQCAGTGGPAISQGEMKWIRERFAQLNKVIIKAAKAAGIVVLDATNAFKNHELCTGTESWVNGADIHTVDNSEFWFHPNVHGHSEIARHLTACLKSFPTAGAVCGTKK